MSFDEEETIEERDANHDMIKRYSHCHSICFYFVDKFERKTCGLTANP